MPYERYVLILDDDAGSLEAISLRLVRMGVDAVYAKDRDEASLLARQEAARVGALLLPAATPAEAVPEILKQLGGESAPSPKALVLVGDDPGPEARVALRELGARWALFAPENDAALRFVVTAALSEGHDADPRSGLRVPTALTAVAYKGSQQKPVAVHNLSIGGAYLATPAPFAEETQLSLEIPLPDGTLLAKARVVHVRDREHVERPDLPCGMGVAFLNLPPAGAERVRRYLELLIGKFGI